MNFLKALSTFKALLAKTGTNRDQVEHSNKFLDIYGLNMIVCHCQIKKLCSFWSGKTYLNVQFHCPNFQFDAILTGIILLKLFSIAILKIGIFQYYAMCQPAK
jgi:hypothetical protein